MAPTALQARIAAFEALNNGDATSLKSLATDDDSEPPASPTSTRVSSTGTGQASVIDLKDWVIEDRPSSSSSSSAAAAAVARSSASPRPPLPPRSNASSGAGTRTPPPRIQVGSPPRSAGAVTASRPVPAIPQSVSPAPPLPPRKSSSPTSLVPNNGFNSSQRSPPASGNTLMLPEADHSYPPPGSRLGRGHGQASSISSFHSVSLSSDAGSGADPASPHVHTFPIDHDRDDVDSLADSFEDVSTPSSYAPTPPSALLKSKPPPLPASAKKPSSLTRIPPPAPIPVPTAPPLPHRSPSAPSFSKPQHSTPPHTPSAYARRVPPPPPPATAPAPSQPHVTSTMPLPYAPRTRTRSGSRAPSVRSSIQSTSTAATTTTTTTSTSDDRASVLSRATSFSSLSHAPPPKRTSTTPAPVASGTVTARMPPIPPPARARYDALFVSNARPRIRAHKAAHLGVPGAGAGGGAKKRANAGWRGLSVDLIPADNAALLEDARRDAEKEETGKEEEEVEVPADARLSPGVVKRIWALSRLDRARLREIWDECLDPARAKEQEVDGLDRDAFARGMWRIDEELRRARAGLVGRGARGSKVLQAQRRAR